MCAVIKYKFSPREHDMSYNPAVLLHDEVELGDEIGITAVLVQYIMLGAAGTINVPESFSREILHLTVILGLF